MERTDVKSMKKAQVYCLGLRVGIITEEVLFVPEREFVGVDVRGELYAEEGHSRLEGLAKKDRSMKGY